MILAAISATGIAGQTPQLVKRTITKTDRFDFGSGGTVAVTGAPNGSIRITAGQKNEIEITATIELRAASTADLDKLADVTGFVTDESIGRVGIVSMGTHSKQMLKKARKKLPKNLFGLPFRIDYVISVPRYCDLEIDGGSGDLSIAGVEGSMRVNFLETNAKVEVISGAATVTIGKGSLNAAIGTRGWRGRSVTLQVATGDMTVHLPTNLSAEIDATILRTGKIENTFPDLKPRDRKIGFTDKAIFAKAGVGGAPLKFSVGDGALKTERLVLPF